MYIYRMNNFQLGINFCICNVLFKILRNKIAYLKQDFLNIYDQP